MRRLLQDAPAALPDYQRRLVTGGYLSRHPLGRGLSPFTGAGLDLGDLLVDAILDRGRELWPLDLLAHPPLLEDPWPVEFSAGVSEQFDCFRLADGRMLWFDTNLCHLDALRERLAAGARRCAVVSVEGLYRPVAAPRPMIRDECIFPFVGLHAAVPRQDLSEEWERVTELVRTAAAAVGLPLLLVRRPGPGHYSRDCLAALLPAPGGRLEPWMLAYELGDSFHSYLGVPGYSVLEFGLSQRVLALGANLQSGRAARFGSAISPTQVHLDGAGAAPADLRCARADARALTRTGLAPVAADLGAGTVRLLSEDYRRTYPLDRSLHALLAEQDRQLLAERTDNLAAALDEAYEAAPVEAAAHAAGVGGEGLVIETPFEDYRDRYLIDTRFERRAGDGRTE